MGDAIEDLFGGLSGGADQVGDAEDDERDDIIDAIIEKKFGKPEEKHRFGRRKEKKQEVFQNPMARAGDSDEGAERKASRWRFAGAAGGFWEETRMPAVGSGEATSGERCAGSEGRGAGLLATQDASGRPHCHAGRRRCLCFLSGCSLSG